MVVEIENWLRNRNTIEFLAIWEQLNNPGFNPIELDGIRKQSGLNSFILTASTANAADEARDGLDVWFEATHAAKGRTVSMEQRALDGQHSTFRKEMTA